MSDCFVTPWTDCSLPVSSVHEISQAGILEWAALSSSRDLPYPGVELGSPALQVDSLLLSPQGSPQMTTNYCIM